MPNSLFINPTGGTTVGPIIVEGSVDVNQGTITTDLNALSTTATWNNAAVTFTHWKAVITDTASGAASLAVNILGGAAGNTTLFSLSKGGAANFGSYVVTNKLYVGVTNTTTTFTAPLDGVLRLTNSAETDFSRLQFGGTTSSFPSLKRNGNQIDVRLADDSAAAGLSVAQLTATAIAFGAKLVATSTAPTIASGGCTSPAVTSNNGTAAFLITIGSSCTGVKTFTLTMPAATTYWSCRGDNHTSDAAQQTNYIVARSTSTTAVVVTSYDRVTGLQEDFTASNTYLMSCMGG